MDRIGFEWDPRKDLTNRRKHGVGFAEAESVFSDGHALLLDDPDHSTKEHRYVLFGLSSSMRLLVVSHTYREGGDRIRLISARKATRAERATYVKRWRP